MALHRAQLRYIRPQLHYLRLSRSTAGSVLAAPSCCYFERVCQEREAGCQDNANWLGRLVKRHCEVSSCNKGVLVFGAWAARRVRVVVSFLFGRMHVFGNCSESQVYRVRAWNFQAHFSTEPEQIGCHTEAGRGRDEGHTLQSCSWTGRPSNAMLTRAACWTVQTSTRAACWAVQTSQHVQRSYCRRLKGENVKKKQEI